MSERVEQRGQDADPVNWKRTGGGVEIYDEANPDAWVRMGFVCGFAPLNRL